MKRLTLRQERKLRETTRNVAVEMVEMQRRLFDVGLIRTAHAVNAASQKLGWEAAEKYVTQRRKS